VRTTQKSGFKKNWKSPTQKCKNSFSFIPIKEISTLPLIQARYRGNKYKKKVTEISNADFLRYSHFKKPIGV